MENIDFMRRASEIISLIEHGINSMTLFPSEIKNKVNLFAELELSDEQAELRRYILSVYTRYQGKIDFRDKNNPKNNELREKFYVQLVEIKEKLKDF